MITSRVHYSIQTVTGVDDFQRKVSPISSKHFSAVSAIPISILKKYRRQSVGDIRYLGDVNKPAVSSRCV